MKSIKSYPHPLHHPALLLISVLVNTPHTHNAIHVSNFSKSTCTFSKDGIYGGVKADCQGQGLQALPSNVLPANTTTLLLQGNSISFLTNDSLINLPDLKCLTLSNNGLQSIQDSSFRHNTKLITLDLSHNVLRLDKFSGHFPKGLFRNLHDLKELELGWNDNSDAYCYNYSCYQEDLLKGLAKLRVLSIDTFGCPLNFNHIFKNTPNLLSLTIMGGATRISNESFAVFHSIRLKSLTIIDMSNLLFIESGAFRHLPDLDQFSITSPKQLGVQKSLESLASLAKRSLVSLKLNGINDDERIMSDACDILTKHMTRYMTQICVQHLNLKDNGFLYVEQGALSRGRMANCLISLDLSGNPLLGNSLELIGLRQYRLLQVLRFTDRKFSFFNKMHVPDNRPNYLRCLPRNTLGKSIENLFTTQNNKDKPWSFHDGLKKEIGFSEGHFTSKWTVDNLNHTKAAWNDLIYDSTLTDTKGEEVIYFADTNTALENPAANLWLPRNMTYINLNRFSNNIGAMDIDYRVKGGENLLELHISDCGINSFVGRFTGLENLKVLDISQNDGSKMADRFLTSFPRLTKLDMSEMKLDNSWILNDGLRVFGKLPELVTLDLSGNDLHLIPSNTFSTNDKLIALGLSRNRLKTIPLDLSDQPEMCLLDLRSNSFLYINDHDLRMLEAHGQKMETFSLWLQGNVFSCGCSNIRFLSWLRKTKLHLDNENGYSCILENGNLTTTKQLQDLDSLRRECNGKTAFFISLIIACLMLLGYCLLIVGMKFETLLKASLIKFIGKTLPLKQRKDYTYDVYIGYSDNDVNLACDHLRKTVENVAGYRRTYLRDRDLIPASDMAESIVAAIDSSWRVVLVMTESFLQEDWSFLALKWAVHSVAQDSNPDRLVVVFTSLDLPRHRILSSVLQVVPESNIVYLRDSWGSRELSPREQDMMVNALCH